VVDLQRPYPQKPEAPLGEGYPLGGMSAAYPSRPYVAPDVDSPVWFVLLLALFCPLPPSPVAKASWTLLLPAIAEVERVAGPDPSVGGRVALMMVVVVVVAVVAVVVEEVGEVDDVKVGEHQQL
jgi:hypothetical protein